MNKVILLSLIGCLTLINAAAQQWTQINSPTTFPLACVEFLNEDTGFVGGSENSGIFKTEDGGSTWTLYQHQGVDSLLLSGNNINDIFFINDTTGFAVGWNAWNNSELILKTTDCGVIWNVSFLGSFGGSLGSDALESIHFVNNSLGFCAGKLGRVRRTFDAGANWQSFGTGTTEHLYSIFFPNTTEGYAVGYETIMKSTNVGFSWIKDSPLIYPRSTRFLNDSVGYISGEGGLVLKTFDAGQTWITKNTGTSNDMLQVQIINEDTVYVAGENYIYISTNGGNIWERQMSSYSLAIFSDVYFINDSIGFCVTDSGKIFKTTNGGGLTAPTSSFNLSAPPYCEDSLISFYNNGPSGYSYEWIINGSTYSSNYSDSGIFQADTTYEIKLVAYNGSYYDTSIQILTLNPSLIFSHSPPRAGIDSVCMNTSCWVTIDTTETGVTYQLKKDTVNIGLLVTGSGGSEIFATGYLDTTSTFTIVATKSGSCGITEQIDTVTVYVTYVKTNMATALTDSIVCENETTAVQIQQSQIGVSYQLMNQNNPIGSGVFGNGSDAFLTTPPIVDTIEYYVLATDTATQCWVTLPNWLDPDTHIVYLRPFNVDFTVDKLKWVVGDTVSLTNLSTADDYYWTFDSGASMAFDTAYTPLALSYSTTGIKEITLVASGVPGCLDSVTTYIQLFDSAETRDLTTCSLDSFIDSDQFQVLDNHRDEKGNSYLTGAIRVTNSTFALFLLKFDKDGNTLWLKESVVNSLRSVSGSGIATDSIGSVYVAGGFGGGYMFIDTVLATNPGNNGSTMPYLAKFDSAGAIQWIVHGFAPSSPVAASDVVINQAGEIIFSVVADRSISVSYTFMDTSNLVLGTSAGGDCMLIKVDSDGDFIGYEQFGHKGSNGFTYTPGHYSLPGGSYNTAKLAAISPKIKIDCNDRIVVYGASRGGITPFKMGQFYLDPSHHTFVGIYDFTYNLWVSAFTPLEFKRINGFPGYGGVDYIQAFDIDSLGNIYLAVNVNGQILLPDSTAEATRFYLGADSVDVIAGSLIAKYDRLGNILWYNVNEDVEINSLVIGDDRLYGYGQFVRFAGIGSQDQIIHGMSVTGWADLFITSHDLNGYLDWTYVFGTSDYDWAKGMHIDLCGNLYCGSQVQVTTTDLKIYKFSLDSICNPSPCAQSTQSCQIIDAFLVLLDPLSSSMYCAVDFLQIEWAAVNIPIVNVDYVINGDTTSIVSNYSGSNYSWLFPDSLSGDTLVVIVSDINPLGPIVSSIPISVSLVPSLDLGPDLSYCVGDTIVLTANNGFSAYIWNTGDTTQSIELTSPGSFLVTATDQLGCVIEDQVNVTAYLNPPPVITISGNTLMSNSATIYQWFFDGDSILGASGQSVIATESGQYTVTAIDSNGCVNSTSISFTYTNLNEFYLKHELRIQPNPASDQVEIVFSVHETVIAVCVIRDLQGRVVAVSDQTEHSPIGSVVKLIDISLLQSGVYYLELKINNESIVEKLIVLN
ncbi:MAG TPA: T9SS type A sorting domain-containing protein [Flavobacteriales bacterium]|nr:T9SS type A sorting domain-containing protein [Flavobacteriales bacterium]